MSTVPSSSVVIAMAFRDAGLPVEIARTYIAAHVPVEVAVKTIKKYSKDVARLRPRRRDAYSLLCDAIGIRAANTFFAQRAPAPADRHKFEQARSALPAAPRSTTSAKMWDEVVSELNKENARMGPPIGGAARVLRDGR
jgi:hypothetical protein